ncbi:S9 family peptidase [Acidicapsa ligni]|uniref:S9 family peptidase n=1 Tax=Acidicapsa ligni TaxID=542300 RepID=UPI0021DF9678|nr:S9 family peptidase [Acidicapsa ligni]
MKKSILLSIVALCTGLFCTSLTFESLSSLAAQEPLAAKKKSDNALTIERVSAEPDSNEQPSLRWNSTGTEIAWMHLVPPAANARDKTPQREILAARGSSTDQDHPQSRPIVLVSAAKVTSAICGNSPPIAPKFNDDDNNTNPYMLIDFAWFPESESGGSSTAALLLIGTKSLAWLDPASGKSRTLISGDEPLSNATIAPDGHSVIFVRDHTLWQVSANGNGNGNGNGGDAHRITPSPHADILEGEPDWPYRNELQMSRAYWWSPDSSRIAWLETDDRAVAKYSLRASDGSSRQITYPKPGGELPAVRIFTKLTNGSGSNPVAIDLMPQKQLSGEFYLPRITWLPDGRHLAIERVDRRQRVLDLFLADALTGKSRLIFTEKDSYWINLSDDLRFLKDGKRFLWTSERSGFRHIYLYDLQGKQLAQLTNGNWEVTRIDAVDETQGRIYFTATKDRPLERHLYSVALDGGDITRISHRPGTHQAIFATDGTHYANVFSSITEQPTLSIRSIGETNAEHAEAASIELADQAAPAALQPVEFLKVKLHMASEVNAFLIRPPNFDASKKYPVIVYMAGGPREQLVRNAWGAGAGGATGLWMQLMAQKGFVVFALDNHGTAGQGHFFEEPIHLRLSAQELADQRDGVLYLKSLPYVDSTRIGACGWGYGGFLVIHAMLDRPILFHAGFAGAPITDWHFYDAVFGERYLDNPTTHADGWDASTALENARYLNARLLVAQGTDDEFVHMENLLTLQDELLDGGKTADTLLLSDRGHILDDQLTRNVIFTQMTDFFIRNM